MQQFREFYEKNKDVKIDITNVNGKLNSNNIKWHGVKCRFIRGIKKFWKWLKSLGCCANNNQAARNLRSGNNYENQR